MAKIGEPNYCGPDQAKSEDDPERFEAEMAIASPGKNWGFCSDECSYVNDEFKYNMAYTGIGLMVYLSEEKCQKYLGVSLLIFKIIKDPINGSSTIKAVNDWVQSNP